MFTDKVIFIKQAGVIFGTKRPLAIGGGGEMAARLRRYIFSCGFPKVPPTKVYLHRQRLKTSTLENSAVSQADELRALENSVVSQTDELRALENSVVS